MSDPNNNILDCNILTDDDNDDDNNIISLGKGIKKTGEDKSTENEDRIVACTDGCLFNLDIDPCEYIDLSDDEDYNDILLMM